LGAESTGVVRCVALVDGVTELRERREVAHDATLELHREHRGGGAASADERLAAEQRTEVDGH
jgi:hypothetical protein